MNDSITALAGSIGMLLLVLLWLAALALALFWPLMAFFAVRHLKGIRGELARLNAQMDRIGVEAYPTSVRTRTGPLGI